MLFVVFMYFPPPTLVSMNFRYFCQVSFTHRVFKVFKLMQAGTEFAMKSCSRHGGGSLLGVACPLYETPLTRVRVSAGVAMPLLGERLAGVCSSPLALLPFSLGSGAACVSFWGRFCLL